MKRILILLIALTFVMLVAVGGWVAGANITSPAEEAARTAPPQPSPILVPVEERLITSDIVARGTARFGLPQLITITPSALKADPGVVTTLPADNVQLNEGDVLLIASGRPVFVLQGDIPFYRDIIQGLSGDDVRQLEDALNRLGFDPGGVDGIFDEATGAAVAAWYAASGFESFGATEDELAAILALEQELESAKDMKLAADDAVIAAPLDVQAAQAEMWAAGSAAQANVDAMTLARDTIWGTTAPAADQYAAEADLSAAKAALGAVYASGQSAVQAAKNAQVTAEREDQTAAENVARITAKLERLQLDAGIKVPVDEIVAVSSLPVRIQQKDVVIGDQSNGRVMLVTNNQMAIDSSLPIDEAPLVSPGVQVTIDEPDLGITTTGVVGRVAETPGTDGADGFHIYLEVLVDEASTSLMGVSLRLTIPLESTGGKVIAVPVSALSLTADGTSRVQVKDGDSLNYIVVEPGLAADGYVEVTPVEGTLEPGQLVIIGFEQTS